MLAADRKTAAEENTANKNLSQDMGKRIPQQITAGHFEPK
jgi:hypothetical protein